MKTLKLTYNESLEFVKLVLAGEGSYLVEEKREHVDVIYHELLNLIKHKQPDLVVFDSFICERLLNNLNELGVKHEIKN